MLKRIVQAILQPGLRDRVRNLEKRLEEVEVEWLDWYQKFRALYARLAKAEKRAERAGSPNGDGGEVGSPAETGETGPGAALRRRRMNQSELAELVRRGRGVLRSTEREPG